MSATNIRHYQRRLHRLVREQKSIIQIPVPQKDQIPCQSPPASDTASGMLQDENALPPTNDPRHWFGKSLAAPQRLREEQTADRELEGRVRSCWAAHVHYCCFSPPVRVAAVQHTQLLDVSCSLLREWSVPALLSFFALTEAHRGER